MNFFMRTCFGVEDAECFSKFNEFVDRAASNGINVGLTEDGQQVTVQGEIQNLLNFLSATGLRHLARYYTRAMSN